MNDKISFDEAVREVYDPYESVQHEIEDRIFISSYENNQRFAD